MAYSNKSGYGSKPWWFWVLVYLVVGAVVYYLVYYFVFAKKGSDYNTPSQEGTQQEETQQDQMYK